MTLKRIKEIVESLPLWKTVWQVQSDVDKFYVIVRCANGNEGIIGRVTLELDDGPTIVLHIDV